MVFLTPLGAMGPLPHSQLLGVWVGIPDLLTGRPSPVPTLYGLWLTWAFGPRKKCSWKGEVLPYAQNGSSS